MNIILIGYRAAGKTSVGRSLAYRLGVPFHDTDEIVVQNTGKTVRELVDKGGWSRFRQEEKSAVAGLSGSSRCVVALGGGAVLDEENVKRLSQKGLFIWLRADARTIVRRMREDRNSGEQRPSLSGKGTDEEVRAMLRSREEVYRKTAVFTVETKGRSIDEVAEEVLRMIAGCYRISNIEQGTGE